MTDDLKNIVIECCKEIISENNEDIVVDLKTELTSEIGIDSFGLVSLVFC